MKTTFTSVEEYISTFPQETQALLNQIRMIVKENAPTALEGIAYGMPAYKINGKPLVYFAAFKKHIGFYATPTRHAQFELALSKYKQGKGSVQFPLDKPIPFDLIGEIVAFRLSQNI